MPYSIVLMYELHMLDLLILRFQSDAGDAGGRTEIWIPRINAFLMTVLLYNGFLD